MQFTPCIRRRGAQVFLFSLKIKVDGFSRFDLNSGGYGSYGLGLKPLTRVSRFGPQNRQMRFGDLFHKIISTASWFSLKTKCAMVYRLHHKISGLLHLEVSRVRVSQSSLKIGRGTT
jgi:hypothetical protein